MINLSGRTNREISIRRSFIGRMRGKTLPIVAAIVMFGIAKPVYADLVISAHETVQGSLSYPGGSSPLHGGMNGGFDIGTLPCLCNLSFTTGPFMGSDANDWFFGPGGSLNLSGSSLSGIDVIVMGTFLGTPTLNNTTGYGFGYSLNAMFLATLNSELLNYFDLPDGSYYGTLFLDTQTSLDTPPPGPAQSGEMHDVLITLTPVPEPTPVFLLATAVIICGIGAKIRRFVSRCRLGHCR